MKTDKHHEATLKPFKTAISCNVIIACYMRESQTQAGKNQQKKFQAHFSEPGTNSTFGSFVKFYNKK